MWLVTLYLLSIKECRTVLKWESEKDCWLVRKTIIDNYTMILSTKSVAIAVIAVLLQCSLCKAVFQTTATHLTMGKTVATPYLTLFSYSDIKCVRKCFNERKQNRCSVAGYDKATETCFLSNDGQQELLDTADEAVGVFFYSGLYGAPKMTFSKHFSREVFRNYQLIIRKKQRINNS